MKNSISTIACLLLCSLASAGDLSVCTGIGWSEESVGVFGAMSERSNPVAILDLGYSQKRLDLGLNLSARFGSKAIRGVTGAFAGELHTFKGAWSIGYHLADDLSLVFSHYSDHSQPIALGQGGFSDLSQRNSLILWKRWE